jgi:hypothetical protein
MAELPKRGMRKPRRARKFVMTTQRRHKFARHHACRNGNDIAICGAFPVNLSN